MMRLGIRCRLSHIPPCGYFHTVHMLCRVSRPTGLKMAELVASPAANGAYKSRCSFSTSPIAKDIYTDPYRYTDGHWLHQDELQREARLLQFEYPGLCKAAIKACDANSVTSYEKREGGYNRVFIFTMDTGKRVVARVPTRIAGPPRLTTNSEVATIAYLKSKLFLPIPEILAWSDDPENPIGIEYIIQELADGVQLHDRWSNMSTKEHMDCTKDLSYKIRDMAALDFPAYGNIYFAGAPIDDGSKVPLEEGFCIGPYCNPLFWNCGAGDQQLYGASSTNKGPWKSLAEYASGLIDIAFARLPSRIAATSSCPYQGSIEDHVDLLNICRETMQQLVRDERVSKSGLPTLVHADYNNRNIYISPTDTKVITGLIDWQLTCIEPAFIYAHTTPDFAALPDIDPSGEKELKTHDEGWLVKDRMICFQTYNVIVTLNASKLRPARELDSSLFRLFHYCFLTWRDGIPAVRQELLDLRNLWSKLQLPGKCPYSPGEKELREHSQQYEDFETKQKLKRWLKISMHTTSDGWMPNELWEAAKDANRTAYNEWIQTARETDMPVGKADKLWPFDAR